MALSIALLGCDGASDPTAEDAIEGSPTFDCGAVSLHTRVECLNEHATVYDFEGQWPLVTDLPESTVLGGEDAVCVPEGERGGDALEAAFETTCTSAAGPVGGLRRVIQLHGAVTRTCDGAVHLWVDYQASLDLPAGTWRVRVDARSDVDYAPNSGEHPACTLRVGGADADLIREGERNVWLSFEEGPRELALELDCTEPSQNGLAGIVCFGWDSGKYPPGPPVSVVQQLDLALEVSPLD